jgi:hypothetical protein
VLDLVTNLSRRPGTAPNAISQDAAQFSTIHRLGNSSSSQAEASGLASRPGEANDVGAADDDHRMPISCTGYACCPRTTLSQDSNSR